MRNLIVFNLVTLDGYFASQDGDISWHNVDDEFQELANQVSNSGNTLLFGRITYQLMANYWPTPEAIRTDPVVAAGMNQAEKVVFSRTLARADWNNTRLVKGDLIEEVRRLKQASGKDLAILGSGSIVAQLAQAGLIDEYQACASSNNPYGPTDSTRGCFRKPHDHAATSQRKAARRSTHAGSRRRRCSTRPCKRIGSSSWPRSRRKAASCQPL